MLSAGRALARILKDEGSEYLFCFPTSEIIEAAALEGLRVITCRTERTVTNMADGYTRVHNGRRIGVCAVQGGPGVENAFVGVAQAYADSSPILMIAGGAVRGRRGLPAMFDGIRNYAGVTKWADRIDAPERLREMAMRAFTKLRNGRRRPVFLELPSDVAMEGVDETAPPYAPVPRYASAGDPADVSAAITLLLRARRPMLYVGQGVLWGEASEELRRFAELLALPVMTTTLGKGAFPEDHPLALGIGGTDITAMADRFLDTADVVVCLGASLMQTLAAAAIPAGRTIVHCTDDADDLNTEYRAAQAIVGDIKLVLRQLTAEAERRGGSAGESPVAEIRMLREAWLAQWMPLLTSDEIPINPYRIVWDLIRTIDPATSIVTHDAGSPRAQIAPFYPALAPRSYIGWGNSHQLGASLGLIMGAKLAAPEKLAVAYMGDAAFGMCGLDLETSVRERIPLLCIVNNNSAMAGYASRLPQATERYGVGTVSGDYTQIARGLGAWAERVDQPAEIVPALRRALAAVAAGETAVLEFMTKVEVTMVRHGATVPPA
jgi:thiamine pyrophosphate-dependent acetolactate synthase large subunit-like protein